MKYFYRFCCFFMVLFLAGCSASSKTEFSAESESSIRIGNLLEINNLDNRLVLLDHKETLAADGLYYLSFGIENQEDETNSETTDKSYSAQLYLLLGEAKNSEDAQKNKDAWIAAGKANYEIITEKELSHNGQSYFTILYNRSTENSTYTHGISAFGAFDCIAVCIELIGTEDFDEDFEMILTDFLDSCSYQIEK